VVSPFARQRLRTFVTKWPHKNPIVLHELIEARRITPVIDRTFPLSETAETIGYVEAGHA
jgi:NADPH:quinone reductase-like Zn-dependent oxidoreductase